LAKNSYFDIFTKFILFDFLGWYPDYEFDYQISKFYSKVYILQLNSFLDFHFSKNQNLFDFKEHNQTPFN